MTTKELINGTITAEQKELPSANDAEALVFDPWDLMGSKMYTYKKLITKFVTNQALQQKLLNGTLKLPNIVTLMANFEGRPESVPTNSLFNFPLGVVAQQAKITYGYYVDTDADGETDTLVIDEHEPAFKFLSHLLLTNILLNIKELFYLVDSSGPNPNDWLWSPVTDQTIVEFKNTPNKFYIMKLALSEDTIEVLTGLGVDTSKSGLACHHNHARPHYQYFVFTTEDPLLPVQYYDLEPETRSEEPSIIFNQGFLDLVDTFDFGRNENETIFSHTNSMLAPEESYSYKKKEPNSDIFIEVNNGEPDVPR